ncbi:MAG: DUF4280 domain-containing protein [bacterium]
MARQVVSTAKTACTMSPRPSQLLVAPSRQRSAAGQAAANIGDHRPVANILPFGPCMSPQFPATAAATSAAGGVLTPQPCAPNTPAPWAPGSPTVSIADQPALRHTDTCRCVWGGTITIVDPGQSLVDDI